jgi:hypothetical protein
VAVQVDVAEMRRLLEPVFGGRWSDQVEGGDR